MFIEHVNLTVADLERSIAFYRDALGLELRWSRPASPDLPAAAHVGDDRHYVALFEATGNTAPATPDYDAVGLNHFGVVVTDLERARARVESLGFTPHHEADYDPGRRFYVFDPDGIEVEFVELEPAQV